MPLISVVLPIYNAEKYLHETLKSISEQTFTDWELIAINDGSSDNSLKILKQHQKQEPRLKIINRENKGLIYTLNEGIQQAKGTWIARIDADDICLPDRFEKQISWLEKQKAEICGGAIERIGDSPGNSWVFPSGDEAIKVWLLFRSAFAHPTVIIKKSIALKFKYSKNFPLVEDYELWTRLAVNNIKMTNYQQKVLLYRIHKEQVSTAKRNAQIDMRVKVTELYWHKSNLTKDLKFYQAIADERIKADKQDFLKIIEIFKTIERRLIDDEAIIILHHHLIWFLYRHIHLGGKTVLNSIKNIKISPVKKFIIACLATFKADFFINFCKNSSFIRLLPLKWFF